MVSIFIDDKNKDKSEGEQQTENNKHNKWNNV